MKRFALCLLVLVGAASVAEACPLKRLKARVQARPVVRYYAAPVKHAVQHLARPVAAAVGFKVCGPGGCK